MSSASWHELKNNFSGGEISKRLVMRADSEVVNRSVARMKNFMPTPQGSVVRTPGPRFIKEIEAPGRDARIIPYLTPANERALVELTSDGITFLPEITELLAEGVVAPPGTGGTPGMVSIDRQIVENYTINRAEPWSLSPEEYTNRGDTLGLKYAAGGINGHARVYRAGDIDTCIITNTATIPKLTERVLIKFRIRYMSNTPIDGGYECTLKVGTTAGGSEIMDLDYKDLTSPEAGSEAVYTGTHPESNAGLVEGTVLYITVQWTALRDQPTKNSTPRFELDYFGIWANDEIEVTRGEITGTVPYSNTELKDIHYVQSPFIPYIEGDERAGKELIFTHPNHPPHRLWFSSTAGTYLFEPIPFTNQPTVWGANNYPATCASFNGRLVLAGAQGQAKLGAPISGATETVWSTIVGKWDQFSPTSSESVNADDSVEFTAIYRSPIQWVYGQKDLLIGALEMEYVASADGIYQPADLGISMHSSHGSSNVQPAGFGETVMFPAEGGTKVRSMNYSNDDDGWLASDMTILHPTLCSTGVVRMVRMRNPHQMLVVLLESGQLALMHYDKAQGVFGWSRINLSAKIKDICVIANAEGVDILYVTIVRNVGDKKRLYLEAFNNWTDHNEWIYLSSYLIFDLNGETNVITGLDHLEGRQVQVVGDDIFLDTYTVVGGQISIVDELGEPYLVNSAVVGLFMESKLETLPIITGDPKSRKRFSEISVRIKDSSIPMIGVQSPDENGQGFEAIVERPPTRNTLTSLKEPSPRYALRDCTVANLGWGTGQVTWVVENLPQRVEVVGIFGKLTGGSI